MESEVIQKLRGFGLNQLEAEVYFLLLRNKPMTAYGVGKMLKKPTANIYKAVEALSDKGALMMTTGKSKLCAAVPPEEFIAAQQRQFELQAAETALLLSGIGQPPEQDETFAIQSVSLVLEKARRMIAEATTEIIIDAFPKPMAELASDLQAAVDRGIRVCAQVYAEIDLPGAELFMTHSTGEVISFWKSQQLNLIADGNISLIALLDQHMKTVHHATWSTHVYLSCILHAGRRCEQTIHKLMALPDSADKLAKMEAILHSQTFLRGGDVPGVKTLFERYMDGRPKQYHMKLRPTYAFVLGLAVFAGARGAAWAVLKACNNAPAWAEQVLSKGLLIVFALIVLRYALQLPWQTAGFRRSNPRPALWKVMLPGILLGALTTLLIIFTPAEGNPMIKKLSLPQLFLFIVLWSTLAEEILIRGLVQSSMRHLQGKQFSFGRISISLPVLVSASLFAALHLFILLSPIDTWTVVITVIATFLLGLVAGHFFEKYGSLFPALITHASFNLGGILTGILVGILSYLSTGALPSH